MKTKTYTIRGIRPLLLSNGRTADPLDPYAKKKKEISSKRKKTDADYERLAEIEWEACLYWSDEIGLYFPSDNLYSAIIEGAKKKRNGPAAKAGVSPSEFGFSIKSPPGATPTTDLDGMRADERFRLRKICGVQRNKIVVTRAMVPTGWTIEFTVNYDDDVISENVLDESIEDLGNVVGIGTWRPFFGRFVVED